MTKNRIIEFARNNRGVSTIVFDGLREYGNIGTRSIHRVNDLIQKYAIKVDCDINYYVDVVTEFPKRGCLE